MNEDEPSGSVYNWPNMGVGASGPDPSRGFWREIPHNWFLDNPSFSPLGFYGGRSGKEQTCTCELCFGNRGRSGGGNTNI